MSDHDAIYAEAMHDYFDDPPEREDTYDCFGNPTPGFPPSISDDFASIAQYSHVPLSMRMEYHYARTDAMIGRAPVSRAWDLLYKMRELAS